MDLFGTAGIRGPVTDRVTPTLAVRVGTAVARHARGVDDRPADDHLGDGVTERPTGDSTDSSDVVRDSTDSSGTSGGVGDADDTDDADGTDDTDDESDQPTVVVGRDGRTTGDGLAAAVAAGLTAGGCAVERVGRVPTPALAYASRGRRGVMLTASHNPPTDNGIKLFVDGTEYGAAAERAVEAAVEETTPTAWGGWGTTSRGDVLDDYRAAVVDYARSVSLRPPAGADATGHTDDDTTDTTLDATDGSGKATDTTDEPATGLRVAVDCGNGMAGTATPQVLRSLGVSVVTLNANVDGRFPGRESKPTAESLGDLRRVVADGGAAFGIGHDGDADRIVIVDGDGEVVHEDTVVAILAEAYTRAAEAATPTVVTTPNASDRIDERVAAAGGRVDRVALGYLHDGIDAADGPVAFAAEPWKHVHTAFGPWIDGVASAAVFCRLVAEVGLDALRAPVTERPYRKRSLPCPDDRKSAAMDRLRTVLPDTFHEASVSTDYGVRLSFSDGSWLLVRSSGTEPYLRVYAESDEVDRLADAACEVVSDAVEHVDTG